MFRGGAFAFCYSAAIVMLIAGQDCAAQDDVRFPLMAGNRWEYTFTNLIRLIDEDDKTELSMSQAEAEVSWEIGPEEDVLGQRGYPMTITQRWITGPDSGAVSSAVAWYTVREDTLQAIAASTTAIIDAEAFLFKPVTMELAPVPEPWHFLSLAYPLRVGAKWVPGNAIAQGPEGPMDIRSVEAVETVDTPLGSFTAYRVVYLLQIDGLDWKVDQWYADVGLVRLASTSIERQVRSDDRGQMLGMMTAITRKEMVLVRRTVAGLSIVQGNGWGAIKAAAR